MKIGIITYHRAINYGAVLQAFALTNFLRQLGVEAEIIDYRNDMLEKLYARSLIKLRFTPSGIIKYIFKNRYKNKTYDKFQQFIISNSLLSPMSYNRYDIKNTNMIYDVFLTGSDQVWNYRGHGFDDNYFLKFVNVDNKKYSYAASFGLSVIPAQYKNRYRDLLKSFQCLSVREEQGIMIIKEQLGIFKNKAITSIDPTLLLNADAWRKIVFDTDNHLPEKYILVYTFGMTSTLLQFIYTLSAKNNLPIFQITDDFKKTKRIKNIKEVGPKEFIDLFSKATYVITNSFHGTAFSINFNKQFFVELLPGRFMVNSRLENILDLFELKRRLIINGQCSDLDNVIDFESINAILEKEREKSIRYLKDIIRDNNE